MQDGSRKPPPRYLAKHYRRLRCLVGSPVVAAKIIEDTRDYYSHPASLQKYAYIHPYVNAIRREERGRNNRRVKYLEEGFLGGQAFHQARSQTYRLADADRLDRLIDESVAKYASKLQHRVYLTLKEDVCDIGDYDDPVGNIAAEAHVSPERVYQIRSEAKIIGLAGLPIILSKNGITAEMDVLLSLAFAVCCPVREDILRRFDFIISKMGRDDARQVMSGLVQLWDISEDGLCRSLEAWKDIPREEHLLVPCSLFMMLLAARVCGTNLANRFRRLQRRLDSINVMNNPYVVREVSVIGAYCGYGEMYYEFTGIRGASEIELCLMAAFQDCGFCSEYFDREILFGSTKGVLSNVGRNPTPVFRRLIEYFRSRIGCSRYHANEGLIRMIINWGNIAMNNIHSFGSDLNNEIEVAGRLLGQWRRSLGITEELRKSLEILALRFDQVRA